MDEITTKNGQREINEREGETTNKHRCEGRKEKEKTEIN
jgi:hypothetical protein